MEEDEQEQRRRKVDAGRAKVNGSALVLGLSWRGVLRAARVIVTAACLKWLRPGGAAS
jgi:hypothetical protein